VLQIVVVVFFSLSLFFFSFVDITNDLRTTSVLNILIKAT
jgi:hypothetical protein